MKLLAFLALVAVGAACPVSTAGSQPTAAASAPAVAAPTYGGMPPATPSTNAAPVGNSNCKINITPQAVLAVAPNSASCSSGPGCRTAQQAAPAIALSFQRYQICSPGLQAALLGTMAMESSDFGYNHNQYPPPGRPGQGTYSMILPQFNFSYALSIPAIADQVKQAAGGAAASPDALSPQQKDAVLALVNAKDEYAFGSAAWYATAQCKDVASTFQNGGGVAAFQKYVTDCLGTTLDDKRTAYFTKALQALGVSAGSK